MAASEVHPRISTSSSDSHSSVYPPSIYAERGLRTPAQNISLNAPSSTYNVFDFLVADSSDAEPRQVRFSERPERVNSQNNVQRVIAPNPTTICWTPSSSFFEWRPYNQAHWGTADDLDQSLTKLLRQVQNGLQQELKGNLYKRAFKCSKKHLIVRQKFQLQQLPASLRNTTSTANGDTQPPEEATTQTGRDLNLRGSTIRRQNAQSSTSGETIDASGGNLQNNEPVEPVSSSYDAHLMTQMFQLSKKLFSIFVPKFDTSDTHEVCNLYWGAVDCIFRVRLPCSL